ncbi:hypothetical protein [Streptomyces sp. NPDC001205]
MSDTTPNSHGSAPIQLTPETPALTPADQIKPEDIGTLSIEYRDGQPVIVVSGGTVIPVRLTVVDGTGNAVAAYAAGPVSAAKKFDTSLPHSNVGTLGHVDVGKW